MSKFNVGDRVRVATSLNNKAIIGKEATVVSGGYGSSVLCIEFDFTDTKNLHSGARSDGRRCRWYVIDANDAVLERVPYVPKKSETFSLGVPPSLADDLQLKPQARKVLAHLKSGKSISPLEARTVYSVERLAASIYDLKNAGYLIEGVLKEDEAGHRYKRYSLVA
jgi:hypothetical protein